MTLTDRHFGLLAKMVFIGILVQLSVIGYVFVANHQNQSAIVNSQRAGCGRGKSDRSDNAKFQRAQTAYISKVIAAPSVKEDVKKVAREARKTFRKTSHSLAQRSKIDCARKFPKTRWFAIP